MVFNLIKQDTLDYEKALVLVLIKTCMRVHIIKSGVILSFTILKGVLLLLNILRIVVFDKVALLSDLHDAQSFARDRAVCGLP